MPGRRAIEIEITPSRIARLHSNLAQSFNTSQAIHRKCLGSKVKVQVHRVKGQGHSVK